MSKYRKLPVVVEAFQWFPDKHEPGNGVLCPISVQDARQLKIHEKQRQVHGVIQTLEGPHLVSPGNWVVTGVVGEKYSVRPDIFAKSYEPVGDQPREQRPVSTNPLKVPVEPPKEPLKEGAPKL
jgi:hypothetical protein